MDLERGKKNQKWFAYMVLKGKVEEEKNERKEIKSMYEFMNEEQHYLKTLEGEEHDKKKEENDIKTEDRVEKKEQQEEEEEEEDKELQVYNAKILDILKKCVNPTIIKQMERIKNRKKSGEKKSGYQFEPKKRPRGRPPKNMENDQKVDNKGMIRVRADSFHRLWLNGDSTVVRMHQEEWCKLIKESKKTDDGAKQKPKTPPRMNDYSEEKEINKLIENLGQFGINQRIGDRVILSISRWPPDDVHFLNTYGSGFMISPKTKPSKNDPSKSYSMKFTRKTESVKEEEEEEEVEEVEIEERFFHLERYLEEQEENSKSGNEYTETSTMNTTDETDNEHLITLLPCETEEEEEEEEKNKSFPKIISKRSLSRGWHSHLFTIPEEKEACLRKPHKSDLFDTIDWRLYENLFNIPSSEEGLFEETNHLNQPNDSNGLEKSITNDKSTRHRRLLSSSSLSRLNEFTEEEEEEEEEDDDDDDDDEENQEEFNLSPPNHINDKVLISGPKTAQPVNKQNEEDSKIVQQRMRRRRRRFRRRSMAVSSVYKLLMIVGCFDSMKEASDFVKLVDKKSRGPIPRTAWCSVISNVYGKKLYCDLNILLTEENNGLLILKPSKTNTKDKDGGNGDYYFDVCLAKSYLPVEFDEILKVF